MTGTRLGRSSGRAPTTRRCARPFARRVEAAGTSFYWAMRLLPHDRRDGMYAVYAFCREVDDIADDTGPPERQAGGARRLARRDRRALCRTPAPSRRPRAARAGRRVIALRRERFPRRHRRHGDGRGAPTSAPPTWRRSTSIAPASRARSAICRCMSSAIRAPTPHRGRRRARPRACSSPTSCATSTRMPRAAGSICRARCSTATASAATSRPRCCAIRRCRRSAATSPRSPSGISPRPSAAMARCSRRAMRPAAVMAAFYRAMLDGAGARRDGAIRQRGSGCRRPRKLWLVLRHGLL